MTEQVATYYYDMNAPYGVYEIFAVYDTDKDFCERNVSYYEVYNKDGICMNEGYALHAFPAFDFVKMHFYDPNLIISS
ncbi:MAG: hypothetical protein ACKOPU_05550 [Candidatus Planktophila sp.]